jgi:hypothetical protein
VDAVEKRKIPRDRSGFEVFLLIPYTETVISFT